MSDALRQHLEWMRDQAGTYDTETAATDALGLLTEIPAATPPGNEEDMLLSVTVYSNDRVLVWAKEGMSGTSLANVMRMVADGFETGDVTRLQ